MSSPSKPLNIASPRRRAGDVAGSPATRVSGSPSPQVLRAQYAGTPPPPNIPSRRGDPITSPSAMSGTPAYYTLAAPGEPSSSVGAISVRRFSETPRSGSGQDLAGLNDLSEEDKIKVLRKHLVSREERGQGSPRDSVSLGSDTGAISKRSSMVAIRVQREDTDPFPVPYDAPGADITHNVYKWQVNKHRQAARPRAASFAGSTAAAPDPAFEHIHEPGGFRRNFLFLRRGDGQQPIVPRNFIEFLYLFGHFAGEDLEEIEEEEEEEEEDEESRIETPSPSGSTTVEPTEGVLPASAIRIHPGAQDGHKADERSPLLGRPSHSRSKSRRRSSVGPHGDASVTDAVLMLLKAFVGTGILFLGRAFFNGGILFSSAILIFIALISLHSFLLLVRTKFVVPGSFGDIGGTLYGPWMRYAILGSIVVSQLGFVSAYIIFVAENFNAFYLAVTNCIKLLGFHYFILVQLIIFLPLALVRNLAKLSTTALIADVFILGGLIYIFGSEASIVAERGIAHVELFNPKDWPLLIGTAVFSFEGIGLVIPVTDAMREPRKFPAVLTGVMVFLMVIFCGAGVMSYLTFGADVQTVVIVNLDTSSKLTQAVQFMYSLAIMLSVPLQLFPAVRIMENGLFQHSGKANSRVKWTKNAFRFVVVFFCAGVSYVGAADLDKFVSFVGSFACVPLCYVYPAMLHYKACARSRKQKVADIALMIFGTIAAIYTTMQTIKLMLEPKGTTPPVFGGCASIPEDLFVGLK